MDFAEQDCSPVVKIEDEPSHHLVLQNEYLRGFAVEIPPYHRTLCHHHPHAYLLYVASFSNLVSLSQNKEPDTLSYRDGECEFLSGGLIHIVKNLKDTAFRSLVVELLPRAGELRRGRDPMRKSATTLFGIPQNGLSAAVISEPPRVRPHFMNDSITVYRIDLGDSVIEMTGPAVIACPYENEVALEERGGGVIKLDNFLQMAWLPPRETGLLRNMTANSATAVVMQVGSSDEKLSPVRTASH